MRHLEDILSLKHDTQSVVLSNSNRKWTVGEKDGPWSISSWGVLRGTALTQHVGGLGFHAQHYENKTKE